ncbi:MAG TPA: periplasmic heavy metal sensor [Thermoanaerobaculia bacterium]|nr:periplasmic heavy metal sensor [Thermoanaerobaculia bacterium]
MTHNIARRFTPLAALVLGAALAGGHAFADGGTTGTRTMGRAASMRKALASLGLSDDQKAKIKATFAAEKPTFQALRTEGQAARVALKAAASAPTPDAATVGTAFLRLGANRKAERAEMQKVRGQVSALLTPAQNAQLTSAFAGAQARWGHRTSGS